MARISAALGLSLVLVGSQYKPVCADNAPKQLHGKSVVVAWPEERIDHDPNTAAWGLWPTVEHREMGRVRVDGIPIRLGETDWVLERGAPCLGEHNEDIYLGLLGYSRAEYDDLVSQGLVGTRYAASVLSPEGVATAS